jgi:hypothetical protein
VASDFSHLQFNSKPKTMSDDKTKTQPQDATRVNVNENYEVQYWTKKFNCSEAELRRAVEAVGVSADKVEEYLKKN